MKSGKAPRAPSLMMVDRDFFVMKSLIIEKMKGKGYKVDREDMNNSFRRYMYFVKGEHEVEVVFEYDKRTRKFRVPRINVPD